MTQAFTWHERAWAVRAFVSERLLQEVPGKSWSPEIPESHAASKRAIRSSTLKLFASPVVPNKAMPWHPSASNP